MDPKLSVEDINKMAEKVRLEMCRRRIKQSDLILPLAEKGITAAPPQLSLVINGKGFQPRFQKMLIGIYEILEGGYMDGR